MALPPKPTASGKKLHHRWHPIENPFWGTCSECGRHSPTCANVLFGFRLTKRVLCAGCRLATTGHWKPSPEHAPVTEQCNKECQDFQAWCDANPPLDLEDDEESP